MFFPDIKITGTKDVTIDIVTVSAAMLAGRQSGSKSERLYGNLASNICNNTLVLKKL